MSKRNLSTLAASTLISALLGSASAAEKSVTITVPKSSAAVPVSYTLLQLRDAIGADFPTQWTSLKVMVGGKETPYQIDDIDGNGRISGPDELAFWANGNATLTVSDTSPASAPSYPAMMTATTKDDATTITSKGSGISAVVSKQGLVKLLDKGGTVIADELGNLRIEGYNQSTFYKDKTLGAYLEGTTTVSGLALTSLKVLPAGPVRTTAVTNSIASCTRALSEIVAPGNTCSTSLRIQARISGRSSSSNMVFINEARLGQCPWYRPCGSHHEG